ncbi:MAG: hypothetical protein ACLQK4_01935 [Acidimicrobiales bacterium]
MATYALSGTEAGKAVTGTFEIAHEGSSALFGFTEGAAQYEEIDANGKQAVCLKTAGAWKCYSGSIAADFGSALTDFENIYGSKAALADLKAQEANAYDTSTSSETIAGQSATCITYHSHVESGSYTVCITSQGEMAKVLASSATGSFTVTLSSYSTTVPSSTFALPATPTTV